MKQGILIILSGPAGVGKGSLRKMIVREKSLNCISGVFDTTRTKTYREKEGRQFHFISPYEFQRRNQEAYYLFTFEFKNDKYGINKDEILRELYSGRNVVIDTDVPLALKLMDEFRGMYVLTVFFQPPSSEELKRRFRNSRNGPRENIDALVAQAEEDLKSVPLFDVVLTNYVLKKTFKRFTTSFENRVRYILSVEDNLPGMEDYVIKRP